MAAVSISVLSKLKLQNSYLADWRFQTKAGEDEVTLDSGRSKRAGLIGMLTLDPGSQARLEEIRKDYEQLRDVLKTVDYKRSLK